MNKETINKILENAGFKSTESRRFFIWSKSGCQTIRIPFGINKIPDDVAKKIIEIAQS